MVQVFYDIYSYFALFRYFRGWFVRRMLEKSKAKVTTIVVAPFFFRSKIS